jgi:phage tail P2-like protein
MSSIKAAYNPMAPIATIIKTFIQEVQVDLLPLLPDSLKTDQTVVYLAQAISETLQSINSQIFLFDPTKRKDEAMLDLNAWEEHVDFYDTTLPVDKKQELVDKAIMFHEKKGTPAAIEELISTLFEDGKVVEWFEYGGQPYTFKIITNNPAVTNEKATEFINALNSIKNIRSHLEKIEITQSDEFDLFFGGFVHIGEKVEMR